MVFKTTAIDHSAISPRRIHIRETTGGCQIYYVAGQHGAARGRAAPETTRDAINNPRTTSTLYRTLPLLICIAASLLPAGAWSKTVRNYYTDQRLVVLRDNLTRYDWARKERDRILKEADKWAAYPDERLRELVPPPSVPRAGIVNTLQCPVHGQEVLKVASMYGWKMDFDHPYKVVCPVGGESYPSNDFDAYLKSGMKDKALLTGEYVDDGWGYRKDPADKRNYWFVGYYAHWMVRNYLHPALRDLSQAYLITGEERYAHKCALLLWQLSQYYPDYAYEKQSSYGTENDPGYLGRLLYHTWETWTVEIAALAYDGVFPHLDRGRGVAEARRP